MKSHARLMHSKWTVVDSRDREKHFIVLQCLKKEEGCVEVELEAIYTGQRYWIDRARLDDTAQWRRGWH